MGNDQIEQEIQAKGLTAPRVTPADIDANIKQAYFFTAEEGEGFSIEYPLVQASLWCGEFSRKVN